MITVADFYIVLLDALLADADKVPHGREGFYILENGEHTWYEVGKALAQAFVELGLQKSPEPTTLTGEEIDKYIGNTVSRLYATHQRSEELTSTLRLDR